MTKAPATVFVDVDDTLVRSVGSRQIPIPQVIKHVVALAQAGHPLWCWSSGGAGYARQVAKELGIAVCFAGFLPKPEIMMDDQEPSAWRRLSVIHLNEID